TVFLAALPGREGPTLRLPGRTGGGGGQDALLFRTGPEHTQGLHQAGASAFTGRGGPTRSPPDGRLPGTDLCRRRSRGGGTSVWHRSPRDHERGHSLHHHRPRTERRNAQAAVGRGARLLAQPGHDETGVVVLERGVTMTNEAKEQFIAEQVRALATVFL